MDFILDNKETELKFQQILRSIQSRKNGDVSNAMTSSGIQYSMNWGVSLIELRQLAKQHSPDHVLALKLWNKKWRESQILATLLDQPDLVTEEQMDFWTKSFENTEIAEQTSANLWVKTRFAYAKALEWCRGKKHVVRYTGIHLMGRLAITDKKGIDELFESFYEDLQTLAKDKKLYTPLYRAMLAVGSRSAQLNNQLKELCKDLQLSDSEAANKLGKELFDELNSDYVLDML